MRGLRWAKPYEGEGGGVMEGVNLKCNKSLQSRAEML